MLVHVATFICFVAADAVIAIPAVSYIKLVQEPRYPAQYEYEYAIHDQTNGDIKQQKENRNGDAVHGFYSLVQPDGLQRIVEYKVDNDHGFYAVVRYQRHPTPVHAAPGAKVSYTTGVSKVAYATPAYKVSFAKLPSKQASVVYTAAPVAKVAYANSAPVDYNPAHLAKISYAHKASHVSYSSPAFSYHY